MNITSPADMLALQGDRVLIFQRDDQNELCHVDTLTIVRVIDFDRKSLRLVKRDGKVRLPDWEFTQKLADKLRPARENKEGAKWEVTLKAAQ
jgi:hypothetical protein